MSRTEKLVSIIEGNKKDTDEALTALRLQAKAWRLVAMIATHNPTRGVALAQWLFMRTVPFTDGVAVAEFVEEHTEEASKAGAASGVFGADSEKAK